MSKKKPKVTQSVIVLATVFAWAGVIIPVVALVMALIAGVQGDMGRAYIWLSVCALGIGLGRVYLHMKEKYRL